MSIKSRLTILSFFQFYVWGAWLITIGVYWFNTKGWGGQEFGKVFSTLGIASIFMPAITGIIADRWINAERLYGILHLLYGGAIIMVSTTTNPDDFYIWMFVAMFFYMPTISLSNSISYYILKNYSKLDVVKAFPPIRVWGTVGFIIAMWVTNLTENKDTNMQFMLAGIFAIGLGLYSFSLPKCPPQNLIPRNASILEKLGLNAFKLFSDFKLALFFLFSMCLGAALQLTNMYGDTYLSDFGKIQEYADSFVVKRSTIIMSISQISETLFILAIPFFLKKYGIKKVMLISMLAWVLRFGLFAYGDPAGGLWMIVLSCVVYGMAFDFFNISGSLYIETNTDHSIRSSAQGLFMMMTNGFGAIAGAIISGDLIDKYFTMADGTKDWHNIWLTFAGYALVVAILFALFFKEGNKKVALENISH